MRIKSKPTTSNPPDLPEKKWKQLVRLAERELGNSFNSQRRKQLIGASKKFLAALGYDRTEHVHELRILDESIKELKEKIEGLSFLTADLVNEDVSDEEPGALESTKQALSRLDLSVKRNLELVNTRKPGPKGNAALNSFTVNLAQIYYRVKERPPTGKQLAEKGNFFSFVKACLDFLQKNSQNLPQPYHSAGSIEKAIRQAQKVIGFMYRP